MSHNSTAFVPDANPITAQSIWISIATEVNSLKDSSEKSQKNLTKCNCLLGLCQLRRGGTLLPRLVQQACFSLQAEQCHLFCPEQLHRVWGTASASCSNPWSFRYQGQGPGQVAAGTELLGTALRSGTSPAEREGRQLCQEKPKGFWRDTQL